jgi:hypothetical protein
MHGAFCSPSGALVYHLRIDGVDLERHVGEELVA